MQTIQIDAANKKVGRIATEIAYRLQGKDRPDWRSHKTPSVRILVTNTDKLVFTGKKFDQKKYYHHTGTIGHLKITPLSRRFAEDSRKVLHTAVARMLPSNRLKKGRLKNLILQK